MGQPAAGGTSHRKPVDLAASPACPAATDAMAALIGVPPSIPMIRPT